MTLILLSGLNILISNVCLNTLLIGLYLLSSQVNLVQQSERVYIENKRIDNKYDYYPHTLMSYWAVDYRKTKSFI